MLGDFILETCSKNCQYRAYALPLSVSMEDPSSCSAEGFFVSDILIIGQVECLGMFLQAFIINCDCSHEKAEGFGSIASTPFLPAFFLFDPGWTRSDESGLHSRVGME
jgi:hypothetical protein